MSHILQWYHIDKDGRGTPKPLDKVNDTLPKIGYDWLHLKGGDPATQQLLIDDRYVDQIAVGTLMAQDTRPRAILHNDDVLLNLRGVNLNPGSDPEDMIGIRFLISGNRVISVERRSLMATADMAERLKTQSIAGTPGGFIASFALTMIDRMAPTIVDLNEQVDKLEEKVDSEKDSNSSRENLAELRRQAIMLRRYLAPQRDALNTLGLQKVDWITDDDRLRIRDAADQATRITEELEAIRERCAIVKDQLADQRAEDMNRNMMILSVVAAIFLPLGLLSGMMGINVSGMPLTEDGSNGFWIVTAIVVIVGILQFLFFKFKKWI